MFTLGVNNVSIKKFVTGAENVKVEKSEGLIMLQSSDTSKTSKSNNSKPNKKHLKTKFTKKILSIFDNLGFCKKKHDKRSMLMVSKPKINK